MKKVAKGGDEKGGQGGQLFGRAPTCIAAMLAISSAPAASSRSTKMQAWTQAC